MNILMIKTKLKFTVVHEKILSLNKNKFNDDSKGSVLYQHLTCVND